MRLTPEKSRLLRAELGLSQRRGATLAGVSRSYLNQFERGRWIATDDFLAKLAEFYANQGVLGTPSIEQDVEGPTPEADSIDLLPAADSSETPTMLVDTEDPSALSGGHLIGKALMAVGLIGLVLAATGNLPAALNLFSRIADGERPQSDFFGGPGA